MKADLAAAGGSRRCLESHSGHHPETVNRRHSLLSPKDSNRFPSSVSSGTSRPRTYLQARRSKPI